MLLILLAVNMAHPVLICPGEFQPDLTEDLLYGGKMRFTVSVDAYGNVVPEMLD